MGPTVVVEADPLCDYARGVLLGFKAMTIHTLLFQRSDDPFDHAVLLRTVRRDELLPKTITAHETRVGSRGEDQAVTDRSRNGAVTRPSVPNRAINACSSAAIAVVALPLLESCQPSSSRVWQSMTRAKVCQPSRPAQTRQRSVAPRTFGVVATDGSASIRGRCPMALLRTCQPLSWKIR